jgi:AraC-like DNA-binding protein
MRVLQDHLRETHNIGTDTPERILLPGVSPLMEMLHIELAGLSDAGRGFSIVRLNPHVGQVLACWNGRGEVLVNGKWEECGPGTAYITPPGQPHAYQTISGSRWSFAWVLWHNPPSGAPPLIDVASPMLIRADPEYLRGAIRGLYRESIGPAQPTVLDRWVELMHAYAVRIGRSIGRRTRRDLSSLWEQVDISLGKPWTCTLLAEKAGMSTETLRRLCQRHNGHGPMHHLTTLRMRRAAMLLESTELKVDSIARSLGYSSAFAFSTAFKRHLGHAPAAYRQRRLDVRRPGPVVRRRKRGDDQPTRRALNLDQRDDRADN